jgi:AraC-like DNA-binding protein
MTSPTLTSPQRLPLPTAAAEEAQAPHPAFSTTGPADFSGDLAGLRQSMRPRVAALGWLDHDAGSGVHNANLPSDQFIVTLRCSDTPEGRELLGPELQVVLTPVRERARVYPVVGRSQIAVAALTPAGMLGLFRAGVQGPFDVPLPLAELCGRGPERELWWALQTCRSMDECARSFGRWLEARLLQAPELPGTQQRVARTALRVAAMNLARYDVQALAAQEGVTRRQLERDFRDHLGVSPGTYARLVRFQRAASAVSAGQRMVDAALDNGYADQAHMSRVFKTYAGITPRAMAVQGARPGRALLREGLAGRVFLLDLPPAGAAATPRLLPRPVAAVQDPLQRLMAQWAA